jgi:hypothetical protein
LFCCNCVSLVKKRREEKEKLGWIFSPQMWKSNNCNVCTTVCSAKKKSEHEWLWGVGHCKLWLCFTVINSVEKGSTSCWLNVQGCASHDWMACEFFFFYSPSLPQSYHAILRGAAAWKVRKLKRFNKLFLLSFHKRSLSTYEYIHIRKRCVWRWKNNRTIQGIFISDCAKELSHLKFKIFSPFN